MRLARLIGPELETLIRESPGEVRELLDEIHPEDISDIVEEFDDARAAQLLTELPTDYAAQVFERLEPERQSTLALAMGTAATARITAQMDADERADFFSRMEAEFVEPILARLEKVDPEVAEDIEELTRWPDTSAGGLMTTDYVAVAPDLRVADAMAEIRRHAREAETINTIFVVDARERLTGVLSVRDLLMAEPDELIQSAMHRNVISAPPEQDQEEVAQTITKYDLNTLPVVDDHGRMLGVITADDIMDVLTEEHEEDVHKMGAIEPIEEGYFDASFGMYIRKRAPWLLILFLGGYLTTSAMEQFDSVLTTIAHLAFYVPLLISAGGNSGSQSSTLVIRGLAVGHIQVRDWGRVLVRELGQGLVLGGLLAVFGMLRVVIAGDGFDLAMLIGVTIVGIVLVGCVTGGMMPIVMHRLGIDPATSSTPFIMTLIDVLGIVIYLGLARLLLVDVVAPAIQSG